MRAWAASDPRASARRVGASRSSGSAVLLARPAVAVDDRVECGEQRLPGLGGEQPVDADAAVGQLGGGQPGPLALTLLLLLGQLRADRDGALAQLARQ